MDPVMLQRTANSPPLIYCRNASNRCSVDY
jgi:hypothetical protein